ncbi:MAG: peptidoglycan editing factor PgeF [Alphaproteobacteria bacterium]|nr:peptidoglycan editing factor PgeF [Alphaproteobacteria bacterium]
MKTLPCLDLKWCQAGFYNAPESDKVSDALIMNQVHSVDCLYLTEKPDENPSVDALITDKSGLKLAVRTADCAPVLIADTKKHLVAAIHAGWKGAFQGIIENTILKMIELGGYPKNMVAGIGPHLQTQSFEVSSEMRALFPVTESHFFTEENGKIYFDFDAYVLYRLYRAGIPFVESVGEDTYSDKQYNSYRRDPKNPARQLSIIEIKEV